MSLQNKEAVHFYIDSIKRSNCKILSIILNEYWSAAAFNQKSLDNQNILYYLRKVKMNSLNIQKICQAHPSYTPWSVVMGRKRKCTELNYKNEKRRKSMCILLIYICIVIE